MSISFVKYATIIQKNCLQNKMLVSQNVSVILYLWFVKLVDYVYYKALVKGIGKYRRIFPSKKPCSLENACLIASDYDISKTKRQLNILLIVEINKSFEHKIKNIF